MQETGACMSHTAYLVGKRGYYPPMDRIYKSGFQVPQYLNRDLARVAAFLEEADAQFGGCVRALDAYKLHYGTYMDHTRIEEEVDDPPCPAPMLHFSNSGVLSSFTVRRRATYLVGSQYITWLSFRLVVTNIAG